MLKTVFKNGLVLSTQLRKTRLGLLSYCMLIIHKSDTKLCIFTFTVNRWISMETRFSIQSDFYVKKKT